MSENEVNDMDILNFPILVEEITALPSEWDFYPILWEEIETNTASSAATPVKETADNSEEIKDAPVQEVSDEKAQPEDSANSSKEEEKKNWHVYCRSEVLKKQQFRRKTNGLITLKFGFTQMEYHHVDVENNQIIVSKYGSKLRLTNKDYAVIAKTDVVDVKGVYNRDAFRKSKLEDSYSQIQVQLIDGRWLVIQELYFGEKEFNAFVDSFREAIK